jgi:hypothetical protein
VATASGAAVNTVISARMTAPSLVSTRLGAMSWPTASTRYGPAVVAWNVAHHPAGSAGLQVVAGHLGRALGEDDQGAGVGHRHGGIRFSADLSRSPAGQDP